MIKSRRSNCSVASAEELTNGRLLLIEMKKPEYIEIRLPGRKSTFTPAIKRYFKRLEDKVLEVNFGQHKERKIFQYKVIESKFEEPWGYWGKKYGKYWKIALELKVPKEDPNRVP